MTSCSTEIRVQDIDHCGLVAGIIDQMGLVEQINQLLVLDQPKIDGLGLTCLMWGQGDAEKMKLCKLALADY